MLGWRYRHFLILFCVSVWSASTAQKASSSSPVGIFACAQTVSRSWKDKGIKSSTKTSPIIQNLQKWSIAFSMFHWRFFRCVYIQDAKQLVLREFMEEIKKKRKQIPPAPAHLWRSLGHEHFLFRSRFLFHSLFFPVCFYITVFLYELWKIPNGFLGVRCLSGLSKRAKSKMNS